MLCLLENCNKMSRIGQLPISCPQDVVVEVGDDGVVCVKGSKGVLKQWVDPRIGVDVQGSSVVLSPVDGASDKKCKALHGLYRALLYNMVVGVSVGFKRTLELVGVGYKASVRDNILELSLGYSHDVVLVFPKELINITTETPQSGNPLIHLECIDKQFLGQFAAKVRALRKVEPYKGKGIRFLGEKVRRKIGKSTKK